MLPLLLSAVLWRAPTPLTIPHGGAHRVTLPAAEAPVQLAFRVRADYPRFAGSNLFLRILVNGREVGLMRDRRTPRLLNKPATFTAGGRAFGWFEFGRWRVSYGPVGRPRDDLVLDVSDLIVRGGPTEVTLEHGPAAGAGPTPLVVQDLRLERGADRAMSVGPPDPPDRSTPRLGLPAAPRFQVDADASEARVSWGGHTVLVRTRVQGGTHEWRRAIALTPTHVEVRDTVHNPTDAIVGLRVRHAVDTAVAWIHLGGRPEPDVQDAYDPWNPTVFTPVPGGGVGLVVEDDVFRQQLRVDYADGTAGLRTDMLCLGAGETAVLVWSIYPTRTASYWDFLNTLRADWGVNQPVPGGYVWFTPDEILAMPLEELAAALVRRRVSVASMWGGWVDPRRADRPPRIGFGAAVLDDVFAPLRERILAAVAALERARPGITVLAYFDAQRDSSPDAPRRYADSLLVAPDGHPERTDWGGRFSPAWSMVPTADNAFGRAMQAVPGAMRALGADGLYWDEMDAVDYGAPRTTRARWDGRSCVLDAAGRVEHRIGLANLLSDEVKLAWAEAGFVLGNSPPTTRRFQTRGPRMIEAQHGSAWSAFAHLSTPLGYIGERRDWAAVREQVDAGLLVAATRLDYAYDAPRMFPLTPEYLQPGTLRGRERIVTTRSGTHGWLRDGGPVRTFRYDAQGREHEARWHVKRRGGAVLVRVRLAVGELAVVERVDHVATAR